MRYTGPVRFEYHGNTEVAQQYASAARKVLGIMLGSQQVPFSTRSVVFDNGVRITGSIISQPEGPDRDRITAPIAAAWGGRYLVSAHIFAPPQLEGLGPVLKVYQYQFVYTGGAGEFWQVNEDEENIGGSLVGVVFVIREGGVDSAAFPIASTIKEPPAETPDAWTSLTIEELIEDSSPWQLPAPVRRYEIAHATSDHIYLDGEQELIHSAWMKKGERHYLAQAFTPATLRLNGDLDTAVSGQLGVIPDNPGPGSPFNPGPSPPGPSGPISQLTALYYSSATLAARLTDVTYETSLQIYDPPEKEPPYIDRITPGDQHNSAADSDWYTSYGVYRAEFDGQTRDFGIMIDAAQTLTAWPLDAAGTGSPDSAYPKIKTNVDPMYVKSVQLNFPADIDIAGFSYRDNYSSGDDVFFTDPFEDGTRYRWHPSSDGKKFVSIVEKLHAPLEAERALKMNNPPTGVLPSIYFMDSKEYKISSPLVAQISIEINPFGLFLGDFTLDVSDVGTTDMGDDFYPVQARFAQDWAFEDAELDDLVIGGFEVHRMSESIDTFDVLQRLNDGTTSDPLRDIPFHNRLQFNRIDNFYTPAVFPGQGRVWHNRTGINENGPGNVYLTHDVPQYMAQDLHFTRVGAFDLGDQQSNIFTQEWVDLQNSWVMEGKFEIRKESGEKLFSKCCRKFKPDEFTFANFFTAQIASLDVSTGSVIFGLCDRTTYISSAEQTVGPLDGGFYRDFYPIEGINKSDKGYAVFHKGQLVETSNQPLSLQLDDALTSPVLSKSLAFWGTYQSFGDTLLQPPISIPFSATRGYNNSDWPLEAATALFNNGGYASLNSALASLATDRWGVRDFPWGLEMYAWFANNHFPDTSDIQNLVSGKDLIAYTGVYPSIESEVSFQPMTMEAVNEPSVSLKHVDVLQVGDRRFSHSDLYQRAFDEEAKTDFTVRFENQIIGPEDDNGDKLKYAFDFDAPRTDEDNWKLEFFKAAYMISEDPSGNDVYKAHLLDPRIRAYCNLGRRPIDIQIDPDTNFSDNVKRRQRHGMKESPFVAKALGPVDIDEEEPEEEDGN